MKKQIEQLLTEYNISLNGTYLTVDIPTYVDKIFKNATIFTLQEREIISGFIAFYDNDSNKESAYLTQLFVNPAYSGRSIGNKLLNFSIQYIKEKGFKNYKLEVLQNNEKAIKLYKKFNFNIVEFREKTYIMELKF
jgi:[ribosomal protein S18]-alanine N-acetyltransferase